jgi:hypothetical protein
MEDPTYNVKPESDLAKKTKEVKPTSITSERPVAAPPQKPNIYKNNSIIWQQKSESLLNDYKFGWNFGNYTDNKDLDVEQFFKRFSSAFITMLSNECTKEGKSSERFMSHFIILQSIMSLIARELMMMDLKGHDVKSLLAVMHGFIDSYVNMKIKGDIND